MTCDRVVCYLMNTKRYGTRGRSIWMRPGKVGRLQRTMFDRPSIGRFRRAIVYRPTVIKFVKQDAAATLAREEKIPPSQ